MGNERALRIFTAAFETETNTFSPLPTGLESFERNGLQRGRSGPVTPALHTAAMIAWRTLAERDGYTVVESIAASAEPAGRVLQSVYERLRDELLADLRTAMPIDVVLLYLHGAMVAENQDDCEGDILARVRQIVGPGAVVGTELDLHCHLTEAMVAHATAIVTFKEYPHDDIVEEAEALYSLCRSTALGRTHPVMSLYDCRMIGAAWPTTREPVRSFVAKMRALECEDVLSVSLGHGYPWGDVADVGAKVLVIADGDRERARNHAADLARAFWEMREAARYPALSIDAALDAALDEPFGPIVLADGADNAGGGAPSDSTFVLRRIIERGIRNVASAAYFDPMSVAICFEAGLGSTIDLRVGGKLGIASGAPLDLRVTVRGLREEHEQDSLVGGMSLGRSAWVHASGVDLVLVSVRTQTFAPNAFTGLGITLAEKKLVVVKSAQHFYRNFEPLARRIIYLAAPGALQFDTENIAYTKRDLQYWPRVEDPFADGRRPPQRITGGSLN
jgi:microcystin degradation protein MlrC